MGRAWSRGPARRPGRGWESRGWALVAGLAAAALAAGCATVPTTGLLEHTAIPPGLGSSREGTNCCGLIMRSPQPGWSPEQIVQNFLLASADFADRHAIAREYLTTAASKTWRPGSGPAVTVIDQPPDVTFSRRPFGNTVVVQISAQELGALTGSGQYIPAPNGLKQLQQEFSLQSVHGQWRIASLPSAGVGQPSHELLLTKDLFQLAYQPRNLYYFDPSWKVLVPDPVFVPVDSSDPATGLVQSLRGSPHGWLEGAAFSAFPPNARLRVQVPAGSKTAIVDLNLPAGAGNQPSLRHMAAQLVWTLTSPSYGRPSIEAVKMEVNGRPWAADGAADLLQDRTDYPQRVLDPPGQQNLYYLASNGAARMIRGSEPGGAALPGEAGTARIPLTSIAVSPDGRYFAGIAGQSASASALNTVYISDLAAAARPHARPSAGALRARLTGTAFTAASWDRADDLWFAGKVKGRSGVWVLLPGSGGPVHVDLPAGTGPVTALRVAPDGVRVAMIIGSGPNAHLVLAAIITNGPQILLLPTGPVGADLTAPSALAWYDADHLLVVNQSAAGPQLDEVPVNGGASTFRGVQPDMISIAAAGPGNYLYSGLQSGHLSKSAGLDELWSQFAAGRDATYPG